MIRKTAGSGGTGVCATETFANLTAGSSGYSDRSWTGDNGLQWNATNARTDQTITDTAITLKNGVLTAPTTASGIGELTLTTKRVFSGGSGSYDVLVNGTVVGTVPYDNTEQTTTITAINITNNVTISFEKTASASASDRVSFDDLSWTCYSDTASIAEQTEQAVAIYPNPINEGYFTIKTPTKSAITIYSVLGKKVFAKTINSGLQTVVVDTLKSGIYFVKINNEFGFTVKKIKIN